MEEKMGESRRSICLKPKVSVILSCYNQASTLPKAIESVLHQSFQNWELMAIDNGSRDESASIFKKYAGDSRIRLFCFENNRPPSQRFNEAIREAKGDYISLLYGDDYYLKNKLEEQIKIFEKLPPEYGFVYGPGWVENLVTGEKYLEKTPRISGRVFIELLNSWGASGFICPISPLIRRDVWLEFPFDEEVFFEAEAVYFRMAEKALYHFDSRPFVVMTDHLDNIGKAISKNRDLIEVVFSKILKNPNLNGLERAAVRRCFARILRNYGWQGIRVMGNRRWAYDNYRKMAVLNPLEVLHPRVWAGLALSAFPSRALNVVNQLGNRLSPRKGNAVLKEDYSKRPLI